MNWTQGSKFILGLQEESQEDAFSYQSTGYSMPGNRGPGVSNYALQGGEDTIDASGIG